MSQYFGHILTMFWIDCPGEQRTCDKLSGDDPHLPGCSCAVLIGLSYQSHLCLNWLTRFLVQNIQTSKFKGQDKDKNPILLFCLDSIQCCWCCANKNNICFKYARKRWWGMGILNGVLVIFWAHIKSVRELVGPILNPDIFTPLFPWKGSC